MTTYTLEAKENLSADIIAVVDAEIAGPGLTANFATSPQDIGISYDRLNRTLVYSVCAVDPVSGTPTNATGVKLWSGVHTINAAATYDEYNYRNFSILTRTLDSETVTRWDAWDTASLVPNGIGPSDGTAKRFVEASYNDAQVIKLVDPRTRNVWSHHTSAAGLRSCLIYEFRFSEAYKQTISPYVPSADRHLELMGITAKWVYVADFAKLTGDRYTLELLPRVRLAAEVTADYLLSDGGFEVPSGVGGLYEEGRTFIGTDASLYYFTCTPSFGAARKYYLYKFTQPSSPPGDPIVGGGWTDATPWAAGTGPNLGSASYRGDIGSVGKNLPIPLPATNGAALLSIFFAGSKYPTPSNDPSDFSIACTYVDLAGAFDYHAAFVTGYMTAAWEPTAVAVDAAWAVWGVWETDGDLAYHDYEFPDVDYTKRWLFFGVSPVVAGVSTPTYDGSSPLAAPHIMMVEYQFVSGAAPVLTGRRYDEANWDALYLAYAAAVADDNVIRASMLGSLVSGTGKPDIGVWDETGSAWWWSGQNTNFWQLDADFTPRLPYLEQPPLMRIGFGASPPGPARRAHVWSLIGAPTLRTRIAASAAPQEPPENTIAPVISGNAAVGETLSATHGTWTGSPTSYLHQWYRGETPISGATGATYLLTEADDGETIPVVVTAANGAGSNSATSVGVGPVTPAPTAVPLNASLPVITGTATVGQVLGLSNGVWTNGPTGYAKQWLRGGSPISGEIGGTYLLTDADEGADIGGSVIASNAVGAGTAAEAVEVGPVGAAPPITAIQPNATYDGTPGSGSAPPTDPVRVHAKAICRIFTASKQRVTGTFTLKIAARAFGGIDKVRLSGDCVTTDIAAMDLRTTVDVNGASWPEVFYWADFDIPAFVAAGGTEGTRAANIYVEVFPTASSIVQRRVMGPFVFYPEATATDGTYNIGSGQTYATLKLAVAAAKAATKKAPEFVFHTTANYEAENETVYTGGKGFAVLRSVPGVTATILRASAMTPGSPSSWPWTLGWDGVEFRGSGIVLDFRNFTRIVFDTLPALFNGCTYTNSIGSAQSLYFNKGPQIGTGPTTASYWQYVTFSHGPPPTQGQLYVLGHRATDTYADIYSHTPAQYGNHDTDSTAVSLRTQIPSMTVRYSGSGAGTIAKTGGNGGGSLVLDDGNHSGAPLTISLGDENTVAVEASAVVSTINARSGWNATLLDTTRAARFLIGSGFGDANGFPATDAKTATLTLVTMVDIHADYFQTYGGMENVIMWNTIFDGDSDVSSVLMLDGRDTGGNHDMSFLNAAWFPVQSGGMTVGGAGDQHILFEHISTNCFFGPAGGVPDTTTSISTNCLVGGFGNAAPVIPSPVIEYVVYCTPNGASDPTGSNYSHLTSLGVVPPHTANEVMSDVATGDFSPIGALLSNLAPAVFPWDSRGVLRSGSDAVGNWSKNAP